jgi:hypothetical protein
MKKDELELLFGPNTRIKVNFVNYITNKKIHNIDCKLYVGIFNEEEFLFLYPDAVHSVIYEVWNFLGYFEPLSITLSYE